MTVPENGRTGGSNAGRVQAVTGRQNSLSLFYQNTDIYMNKQVNESSGPDLLLADTLKALRSELQQSQLESADEGILFRVDKVELELRVVVKSTGGGEGKIRWWVVEAGLKAEETEETSHLVKLTLNPIDKESGGPVNVSSRKRKKPLRD